MESMQVLKHILPGNFFTLISLVFIYTFFVLMFPDLFLCNFFLTFIQILYGQILTVPMTNAAGVCRLCSPGLLMPYPWSRAEPTTCGPFFFCILFFFCCWQTSTPLWTGHHCCFPLGKTLCRLRYAAGREFTTGVPQWWICVLLACGICGMPQGWLRQVLAARLQHLPQPCRKHAAELSQP